jgi:hypothetical protein
MQFDHPKKEDLAGIFGGGSLLILRGFLRFGGAR